MHSYLHNIVHKVLFIYFYGELEGSEVNDVILKAAEEIGSDNVMALKVIVADLRHITGCDVKNTDMARVVYFENAMAKRPSNHHFVVYPLHPSCAYYDSCLKVDDWSRKNWYQTLRLFSFR